MTREQVIDLLHPEILPVRANVAHNGTDILFDYQGRTYVNWAALLSYMEYNNLIQPDENLQKALIRLLQSKYIPLWEHITGETITEIQ